MQAAPSGAAEEELAGPPQPVALRERIASLDLIRGSAVMGILMSNIGYFSGLGTIPTATLKPVLTGAHAGLNSVLFVIQEVLGFGRTRGLLGLIFGAGVLLLTTRIEQRQGNRMANRIFVRRHLWMMVLGLLHAYFIWDGDFLFPYGVMALLLLSWCRRIGTRTLVIWGLLLAILPVTLAISQFHHALPDAVKYVRAATAAAERRLGIEPGPGLLKAEEEWRTGLKPPAVDRVKLQEAALAGQAPYSARLHQPWRKFVSFEWLLTWVSCTDLSGMMLLGMALLRTSFLTGELPRRTYVRAIGIGLLASVPLTLLGVWEALRSGFATEVVDAWIYAPMETLRINTILAIAALMVLWARSGKVRLLSTPVAAVGRMAFSNYILTSVICQTVFVWGPWKLYGEMEYYQTFEVVLGVWIFNLVFSTLWLRWFAFGPLEWLWRLLTYGQLPLTLRNKVPA